jgi:hypothetical protein
MLTATAVWGHDDTKGVERNNTVVLSHKAEESEKNITGVKVMYNPIAEQINVNFKLAKESAVVIKLMDALGNEVLSLSNSTYEEGSQSLSFETEGKVSAGFYFVKLTSGTETVIKRVSIR